jgi:PilZ domain
MTLSSMVVSHDWQEVSVLECILGGLHIGVEVVTEPERAWKKLFKSKVDALIVDCDLEGTNKLLRGLHAGGHHAPAVPLVILSGSPNKRKLEDITGAFTFEKPISVEQAVRTLSAARNLILDGRLRYHRHNIDSRVFLTCGAKKPVPAQLTNLSQGGMGIHLGGMVEMRGRVQVVFELPGSKRQVMKAGGEFAWTDQYGNAGIRFLKMSQRQQRGLQLWLERQYFSS